MVLPKQIGKQENLMIFSKEISVLTNPLKKCVTDTTEIKDKDGKLYVSAIFDCFDSGVLGLDMEENRKATLCEHTLDNAMLAHPDLRGAIIHSDRGTQYTSERYRKAIAKYGVQQNMNSAGGRCHDNARCESMFQERYRWGRKVRTVTVRAIDLVPQNEADQFFMFVDTERLARREKWKMPSRNCEAVSTNTL